ncbi:hypothetical protein DINM_002254 [Dirofilaria immitis]|nr:hypothetical protein [Dirofilaria immitis]
MKEKEGGTSSVIMCQMKRDREENCLDGGGATTMNLSVYEIGGWLDMVLSELVHFLRRRVRPPEPESEQCLLGTEPTCFSTARLSSPQRQHIDALLVSFAAVCDELSLLIAR